MTRLGVKHVKSSAYNSSSNGRAERVVRSIKEFLQKFCFKVNNHTQNGKTGSAAERLLRRKTISLLPNSKEREVDCRRMFEERTNEETILANKPGQKSSEKSNQETK